MAQANTSPVPPEIVKDRLQRHLWQWFSEQNTMKKLTGRLKYAVPKLKSAKDQDYCKSQAMKLLVADLMLQENMLLTLSVFATEVPSLYGVPEFLRYVSLIRKERNEKIPIAKPHFDDVDVNIILQAFGFNPSCRLIQHIKKDYEQNNKALLNCIVDSFTTLMHTYCLKERELQKLQNKEKCYKETVSKQEVAIEELSHKLKKYENMLTDHQKSVNQVIFDKTSKILELNKLLEDEKKKFGIAHQRLQDRELELIKNNKELLQKETRLSGEVTKLMENSREQELRYQRLLCEKLKAEEQVKELKSKEEQFEKMIKYMKSKYEGKLRALHEELHEIRTKLDLRNTKPSEGGFATLQSHLGPHITTKELGEYLQELQNERNRRKLLEKELLELQSNWTQRYSNVTDIANEMSALKQKLGLLQKEVTKLRRSDTTKEEQKISYSALDPVQFRTIYNKIFSEEKIKKLDTSLEKLLQISSDSSSRECSSTDDIVEEARYKLEQLEKESQLLNRNFQNLQNVLSRSKLETNFRSPRSGDLQDSPSFYRYPTRSCSPFRHFFYKHKTPKDSEKDKPEQSEHPKCAKKLSFDKINENKDVPVQNLPFQVPAKSEEEPWFVAQDNFVHDEPSCPKNLEISSNGSHQTSETGKNLLPSSTVIVVPEFVTNTTGAENSQMGDIKLSVWQDGRTGEKPLKVEENDTQKNEEQKEPLQSEKFVKIHTESDSTVVTENNVNLPNRESSSSSSGFWK